MMPAVPAPKSAAIRVPVELKLKRNYKYDSRKRVFESGSGTSFDPISDCRKIQASSTRCRLWPRRMSRELSQPEKELRRYMQVILPQGVAPQDFVDVVRAWPSVEEASVGPDVSLPDSRVKTVT
jgi:hypothetical protein